MILIALGANLPHPVLGPAPAVFNAAVKQLEQAGLVLQARSQLYDNEAVSSQAQPEYTNAAVLMEGDLSAEKLIVRLLDIEAKLGRQRGVRWGPRIIDIDLIAFKDEIYPNLKTWTTLVENQVSDSRERLILPHPRAHVRNFVLQPIFDVAPKWVHPVFGCTVQDLLASLEGAQHLVGRDWQ